MREAANKNTIHKGSAGGETRKLRTGRLVLIITGVASSIVLAAAVHAYNHSSREPVRLANASVTVAPQGGGGSQPRTLRTKLSFQPVADKFRRLLGQRFVASGKEMTILTGTLTVGAQQNQVVITRTLTDEGEQVTLALNGGSASVTWSATRGALSGGAPAAPGQRAVVERLALDSADELVLAQLRASYRRIGQNVAPKGAGEIEDYSGHSWDVVLVTEPVASLDNPPLSNARLYYINTLTGLLDKIVSREDGEAVTAEFSGWMSQAGEKLPTHIIWRRNDQVIMQLDVNGVSYGPAQ